MPYQITLEENASAEDISRIGEGIDLYVAGLFSGKRFNNIAFFLRDDAGTVLGGVAGNYGYLGGFMWMLYG